MQIQILARGSISRTVFQNSFCSCFLSVLCLLPFSFPFDSLFPFRHLSLTSLFPSFCYQSCSGSIALLLPADRTKPQPNQATIFAKGERHTCWRKSISPRLCKTETIHAPEELAALSDLPMIRMPRSLIASNVQVDAALPVTCSPTVQEGWWLLVEPPSAVRKQPSPDVNVCYQQRKYLLL